MPFGFVILGMVPGLIAATTALICGSGFGMAFLIYAGVGSAGFGLAVLAALLGQGLRVGSDAFAAQPHLQ